MPTTETIKVHGGAAFDERSQGRAPLTVALEMVSLFASVGAHHFDLTVKDDRTKTGKIDKGRTVRGLSLSLPEYFSLSEREQKSIIIRPRADAPLIQLDDLDAAAVEKVRGLSFITIETSKNNFQSWVCVRNAGERTARSLRETLRADLTASGAVRVCGTRNFKPEYGPEFPTVRLVEGNPGRTTTTTELEACGLLSPPSPATAPEPRATPPRAPSRRDYESSTWPDYSECLVYARSQRGGTDTSRADSRFCWISARRGFALDAITEKLLETSEKVARMQSEHEARRYAERTVRRAYESAKK